MKAEAAFAKPRSLRLDYAFSGGGATCRDFWQASGPKQTQAPITAWRQAFKQLLAAGELLSGVPTSVASMSVVCNDPAPGTQSDYRRVSLTAQLAPDLTLDELSRVFLGVFIADDKPDIFVNAFVSLAGSNSPFQPIPFDYNATFDFYLCPVGFGICAPYRWDPNSAHFPSP
ncbi:hypothetical protein N2152v2_004091 [Parachlorella kessleri]